MITQLIASLFGTANDRILRRLAPVVQGINSLEPSVQALDNEGLRQKTDQLREQIAQGKSLDDVLPEAFAVVREASARALGQRHFDVQLIGGIALHEGNIAEMKTGEGKTLTATLPLYLNALSGKSAHLVTVNDYLARRDAEWMSPIYTSLGLSVGCLQNNMNDNARQEAYNSDILYATNNELGFDYLRDNMKFRKEDYVQRDLIYAIVDEVDSILIDEARTPLIISGAVEDSSRLYIDANRVVARLEKNVDYTVDEKDRLALLTESGTDKVETAFNIANLYAVEHLTLLHHINQALRAHALFRRDVEYVVKDGEVLIVDEFTGRILSGRRYSDGLHQALEAKENVTIEEESQTLASITLQNFFRLYTKLAGMTGTASTEAEEFHNIYGLNVISIPTNQPMIRIDRSDLIFLTERAKFKAIVQDVGERHKKGQPILIGTIAIETSERLSALLHHHDIPHDVLNAKQHEREAEIVAHAGEPGQVTIATNMAGRGTDIKLTPDSVRAGGLYILGTERHESRRIDNQLRGRSGRQGDPGESRFYISLEDELIRIFAGDTLKKYMERFGMKEDEIIESSMVSRTIERAQEKREKYNYEIRKHLLEYDDVLNQQRIVIYQYRRDALEGDDSVYSLIRDFFCSIIEEIVARHVQKRTMTTAQQSAIMREIAAMLGITIENMADFDAILSKNKSETFVKDLINFFLTYYELFRNQQNLITIKQAEKWLVLNTIDQSWKQHMLNLDHLKEGIGLRGWGQKNPLIEYKREAFDMFKEMMLQIQQHIISHIFRINVDRFDAHRIEQERERELENINLIAAQDPLDATPKSEPAHLENKIGRNDPCPCGSGKKYKKCCGIS